MEETALKTYRAAIIGCGWRSTGEYGGWRGPSRTSGYPFSHAQGFVASERTEFVAAADFQEEALARVGKVYEVPKDHLYTDFREMIEKEKLDIVSIGTQQEQRAEITVHAAEAGVKAIYAEKPMAASMADADAMVETVERNGVAFNLGTNRRWSPGYEIVRDLANGGEYGDLKTIITYNMDPIFISGSHWFDLINWINADRRAVSVQATLTRGADMFDGDVVKVDAGGHGTVHYENGVTAYCLTTPRGSEQEVICEGGAISIIGNGSEWYIRRLGQHADPGRAGPGTKEEFPDFPNISTTQAIIEELVNALDTGDPTTRGGVRQAHASTELIFALMESHLRGGQSVELPLKSNIRLQRDFDPQSEQYRPGKLRKIK
jgi:predicted dehydrogenase